MSASPRPCYTTATETIFTPDPRRSPQHRILDLAADLFPLCCIECFAWFYGDNLGAIKFEHDPAGRAKHWNVKFAWPSELRGLLATSLPCAHEGESLTRWAEGLAI